MGHSSRKYSKHLQGDTSTQPAVFSATHLCFPAAFVAISLQAPLQVLALYPDAKLQGLPPVTLISAQIDPLQSDGVMLEKALKAGGVAVERKNYDGVTHEFFGMAAVVKKAKDAQEYAGQRLKRAWGR